MDDFTVRTDLALEAREAAVGRGIEDDGVLVDDYTVHGVKVSRVLVTGEAGKKLTGREPGQYYTMDFGHVGTLDWEHYSAAIDALADCLRRLLPKGTQSVAVAALGNRHITADAIGPEALDNIIVTRHIKDREAEVFRASGMGDVAGIAPGVLGQTGIESAEIIRGMVAQIRPDAVIAIDSLASRRLERLATTLQLSDTGIAPGAGIGNRRAALNQQTLGVPVIAIGIPTVVDIATLAYDVIVDVYHDAGHEPVDKKLLTETLRTHSLDYFVTPKDCDVLVSEVARMIGYAVNRVFHGEISYEEMGRYVLN